MNLVARRELGVRLELSDFASFELTEEAFILTTKQNEISKNWPKKISKKRRDVANIERTKEAFILVFDLFLNYAPGTIPLFYSRASKYFRLLRILQDFFPFSSPEDVRNVKHSSFLLFSIFLFTYFGPEEADVRDGETHLIYSLLLTFLHFYLLPPPTYLGPEEADVRDVKRDLL